MKKKFDGQYYSWHSYYETKAQANKEAEKQRSHGYKARVIPEIMRVGGRAGGRKGKKIYSVYVNYWRKG